MRESEEKIEEIINTTLAAIEEKIIYTNGLKRILPELYTKPERPILNTYQRSVESMLNYR